jgi:hypothetical protein
MEPAFAISAAFSVRHQHRDRSVIEDPAGEPAEHPFVRTAVAVSARDEEAGLLGCGGEEADVSARGFKTRSDTRKPCHAAKAARVAAVASILFDGGQADIPRMAGQGALSSFIIPVGARSPAWPSPLAWS